MLIFGEGGKPKNPEKTLGARKKSSNKLNPLMTPGLGLNSGYIWEASAISTAPPLIHDKVTSARHDITVASRDLTLTPQR